MPSPRPLPGIRFSAQAGPLSQALPRLDIPVFVGFAASGPLHQPVAVEDPAHFANIFGNDIPLVRGSLRQTIYGYLGPTVRSFFRNGGVRAWVIRVAGLAKTNQFIIPGLVSVQDGVAGETAAVARSEGSWSDDIQIGTALTTQLVPARAGDEDADLTLDVHPSQVIRGDLLRVRQGLMNPFYAEVAGTQAVGGALTIRFGRTYPKVDFHANENAVVEKLTFEIRAKVAEDLVIVLRDLGFCPAHPRYWQALPTDAQLYTADLGPADQADSSVLDNTSRVLYQNLWSDAAQPRFPLAGGKSQNAFFIPSGMLPVADLQNTAIVGSGSALQRDGLAEFSSKLFLDSHLAFTSTYDLLSEAFFLRYQAAIPTVLTGIHAALSIEEATLIAVPDAVHRDWKPSKTPDPASPLDSSPLEHPEWWHDLPCNPLLPQLPRTDTPPTGHFLDCSLQVIAAPHLSAGLADVTGSFHLWWTQGAAISLLEEAGFPDFRDAVVIYTGEGRTYLVFDRPPGDYYYRVRQQVGSVSSDYSNGVVVRVGEILQWEQLSPEDYDAGEKSSQLLLVHTALLKMCAARGDLFAVLGLPSHFREKEALAYSGKLQTALASEANALSYGAIYHPWTTVQESDALNTIPPDGASLGIIARRTLARGAWIAPANELFRGVVALDPPISHAYRQAFQDAQINLVRQEPAGVLCLDADTVSLDPDLVPINVRRLLILLRRLALKTGSSYVFEPNDERFRRLVQTVYDSLLSDLFQRGAFAGQDTYSAFRVITSDLVNPLESVNQGRFVVELRVAPSLPLTFLTVRLLQTPVSIAFQESR